MKLAFLLCCLAFPSCASQVDQQLLDEAQRNGAALRSRAHLEHLESIRKAGEIQPQTKEEAMDEKIKMVAYYDKLVKSIRDLDDGTSPANVIGRAAVAENVSALKTFKTASVAHLRRSAPAHSARVDEVIESLPRPSQIDDATTMVLRHRKGTLDWTLSQ